MTGGPGGPAKRGEGAPGRSEVRVLVLCLAALSAGKSNGGFLRRAGCGTLTAQQGANCLQTKRGGGLGANPRHGRFDAFGNILVMERVTRVENSVNSF